MPAVRLFSPGFPRCYPRIFITAVNAKEGESRSASPCKPTSRGDALGRKIRLPHGRSVIVWIELSRHENTRLNENGLRQESPGTFPRNPLAPGFMNQDGKVKYKESGAAAMTEYDKFRSFLKRLEEQHGNCRGTASLSLDPITRESVRVGKNIRAVSREYRGRSRDAGRLEPCG